MISSANESDANATENDVRKVTIYGSVVNLLLALVQLVIGIVAGSPALLADAAHTLTDLFGDGLVLLFNAIAESPADEDHPYGHGKFEAVGTMLMSALLFVTGLGLAWKAYETMGTVIVPSRIALAAAFIGIISKEILYRWTRYHAKRLRSQLLMANAWHHRSDAISSIASFLGIAGALAGHTVLDPAAAVLVSLLIASVAIRLGWAALQQLLDTALETELLDAVQSQVADTEGVLGVHAVRARRMGPNVLIDLHIEVPGKMSVFDAHAITERVEENILQQFSEVTELLIHVDPIEIVDEKHRNELTAAKS